jgi:hypothetical protein
MTGRALAGRGRTPTAALTVAFQNTPSAIEISFRPAFAALFFISAMIVAKAGMRGADTFAQCPDGGYAAGAISKGWRPEFFAVRRETGREQSVKVRYDEGVAIRIGPEPCAVAREGRSEASVGECAGQP